MSASTTAARSQMDLVDPALSRSPARAAWRTGVEADTEVWAVVPGGEVAVVDGWVSAVS